MSTADSEWILQDRQMGNDGMSPIINYDWVSLVSNARQEEAHVPMEVFWNCSDLLSVICLSSDREGSGSLQDGGSSFPVGRKGLGLWIKLFKGCRRWWKGVNWICEDIKWLEVKRQEGGREGWIEGGGWGSGSGRCSGRISVAQAGLKELRVDSPPLAFGALPLFHELFCSLQFYACEKDKWKK